MKLLKVATTIFWVRRAVECVGETFGRNSFVGLVFVNDRNLIVDDALERQFRLGWGIFSNDNRSLI
jgi:hypothetical protein